MGWQRRCDTITRITRWLAPNTKATEIEKKEHTFYLFLDDNLMNKNLYHTKNRINETVARLQRVESCNKSIEK